MAARSFDSFFHVLRDALKDDVENTAGFASVDHVDGEFVKDFGVGAHGLGESCAAFDGGADTKQSLFKGCIELVDTENFQTLHQG